VITHERGIAQRLPRRIEMLDGRIVSDSSGRHASSGSGDLSGSAEPTWR
jgi:ABC-type lipoprotein export system ATPase subunit